ncbi:DUF6880 family protein [Trueperella pyogenes]|uniref:DUF6880 family protein n=1 Tax=Trueperella pyogenes TaxID=1661 RepID=UPI002166D331|nr:DUF6880 family protein [Trueperella pyogenes]UVJ55408.1 hypothetical protein M1F27_08270 [Trueperella pyogenes]UVJ57447.1 hypothetical protein M1F28_08100 [Trueperella pyogenes]
MSTNSPLADLVLPYFRTNSRNLWQWSAANAHGESMFNGLDIIESAIAELNNSPRPTYSGAQIFDVIHRALNSSMRVLLRADDSSGIIGEAIQALLNLHARMAVFSTKTPKQLASWFIKFHDGDTSGFFFLDPVEYRESLGEAGMAIVREWVGQQRHAVEQARQHKPAHSFISAEYVVTHLEQRFAVLDKDIDAIIAAHVRDGKVAAWYRDAAKALAEIGEYDLAITWASKGAHEFHDWQGIECAQYLIQLIRQRHPEQLREVARDLTYTHLHADFAGLYVDITPTHAARDAREEMLAALAERPLERAKFMERYLDDPAATLDYLEVNNVDDQSLRERVADQLLPLDPLRAICVYIDGIADMLVRADTRKYAPAARALRALRRRAKGTGSAEASAAVEAFILGLRAQYKNRLSMIRTFDKHELS